MKMLLALELYSGIGGFHYALKESQIPHRVVAAADINNVANNIYRHNFPETKILQRSIESISVRELDALNPHLIHMSPPCQPFARVGKQQDAGDQRTRSFLHLIEVIPQMKKPPSYIFMENVKGFDTSDTREAVLKMLQSSGYVCQEFLVSPLQFGIPNSRLRYYLLAKRRPCQFAFDTKNQIWETLPPCASQFLTHLLHQKTSAADASDRCEASSSEQTTENHAECSNNDCSLAAQHAQVNSDPCNADSCASSLSSQSTSNGIDPSINDERLSELSCQSTQEGSNSLPLYEKHKDSCQPLRNFLESPGNDGVSLKEFLVPPKFLQRFWVMDIVRPHDTNSCCFTKRYGHHIEGAGSVIQTADNVTVDLTQYKRDRVYTEEVEQGVASLKLRFFTPREIANLMCFPQTLEFPPDVSTIQRYRVLGNSLNIHVVAVLLQIMVMGDDNS